MRWRSSSLLALVVAMLALLVAGCGFGGGDDDGGGGGGGEDSAATGDSGGGGRTDMTMAFGGEPTNLDPLLEADGIQLRFGASVYEGLVARDGAELVPSLAESWEVDGNTWTFKLREGVTFHNGQPMTAEDVVASWNRILDESSKNLGSFVIEGTKAEAVDDMTVAISRDSPDPTTPGRATLVRIVPAEYAAMSDKRLETEMVGTGPYKFDSWERGQQVKLSAYEDYWGEAPPIKNVTLRFDPELSVRLAALQAGEIEVAEAMSADVVSDEFNVVVTPASEVMALVLNSRAGPLKDERLRHAIAYAIDRETIMSELLGGYATPAAGQVDVEAVFGHSPDLEPVPYDPERARQLLEEADAVGTEITLLGTTGRYANDSQIAQALTEMFNKVGFKTDLRLPPQDKWLESILGTDPNKAMDIMHANLSNELFDASKNVGFYFRCDGGGVRTCDPKVDKLSEQALGEVDEDKRAALYHEMWKYMYDKAYFTSIAEVPVLTFTAKNLQYEPGVDGFFRFQDMSYTE
jgi:peptide/nickel transport system substrate-binding protein